MVWKRHRLTSKGLRVRPRSWGHRVGSLGRKLLLLSLWLLHGRQGPAAAVAIAPLMASTLMRPLLLLLMLMPATIAVVALLLLLLLGRRWSWC